MKIAVTGATGFLGRHVLQALSKRKSIEVVGMSRSRTAEWPSDVRHVALDMASASPTDLATLGHPDAVIHLAWSGLPNYKSLQHFESQLVEQYRFLSMLIRSGLPALVCTGTCFEYGMRSGELDEALVPDPQNPYGFAKDALRRQLTLLQRTLPFNLTWARLFYMYGEGQPATSLYPQVMAAGRRGDAAFRMSPGDQLRDYLPVATVAERLVALACDLPQAGIVNVCSGTPVSVRTLVEGWIREQGWNMELELGHYAYPDYEPMAFWGANSRLQRLLAEAGVAP